MVVIDRSYLHGDIVSLASNPFSQSGYVINVNILCDLEVINPYTEEQIILKNVNSKHLEQKKTKLLNMCARFKKSGWKFIGL